MASLSHNRCVPPYLCAAGAVRWSDSAAGLQGDLKFVASVGQDKRVLLSVDAAAVLLRPVLKAVGAQAFKPTDFQVPASLFSAGAVIQCCCIFVH